MRVTSKGQVTIPLEIRKRLNLSPGTEIDFIIGEDDRVYIVKSSKLAGENQFAKLRGIATVKTMTTEEIMALLRPDA